MQRTESVTTHAGDLGDVSSAILRVFVPPKEPAPGPAIAVTLRDSRVALEASGSEFLTDAEGCATVSWRLSGPVGQDFNVEFLLSADAPTVSWIELDGVMHIRSA